MNYKYTDRIIACIDKRLIEGFSRLKSVLSYDELNVMQEVNTLYYDCFGLIKELYLKLANKVYRDNRRNHMPGNLDEMWLDEILDGYDPVSKYVFSAEIDRKAARLIEAIMASQTKPQEVDGALRSLSLMLRIYAVRVTDEAVLKALRDDGEDLVRWVAEKDEKTCSVCNHRDGKVYDIELLPSKPHINCRCRFKRV